MKRILFLVFGFALVSSLAGCSAIGQSPPNGIGLVKPGNTIGEIIIEQGSPDLPYYYFRYFCDFIVDVQEPISNSIDCEVPPVSGLVLDIGWFAKESKLPSNWDNIEWELYIDGYQVALDEFVWFEKEYPVKLENNKSRSWLIDLKNLSPGQHTLRMVQNFKNPVDDGINVYQSGRYEYEANFTVLEKVLYTDFPSAAKAGQHPYSSKKSNLDFLFYLPEDYDSDSQQTWPLLIYLHGTLLRGATLDMLLDEPLPKMMGREGNFPFVVVSPIGDGEYQFWIESEMTTSLFTLLDEIQGKYAIDKNRIYLIGDGMGGNGVWQLGLNFPDYFAALVPIGGYIGYPFEVPENICDLKYTPVWAFHGGKDIHVPASVEQELVDALIACGGNAKISLSDDMTINILFNVYKNPELYDWLLVQSN